MYLPKQFRTDHVGEMHGLMRQYNFATLVTQHDGAPFATHLPFLLDAERGEHGTLVAHVARANPQWRDLAAGQEALSIFGGPHAYVSPSWYDTNPNVPTWNYAAVHAYGVARLVEDRDELASMLERLVDTHEAGFAQPWRMDLPGDYLDRMLRALVGFEIEITRLEGKLKMSQNRTPAERERVAAELSASADPLSMDTAALMRS
jgi:transcriptional regulator